MDSPSLFTPSIVLLPVFYILGLASGNDGYLSWSSRSDSTPFGTPEVRRSCWRAATLSPTGRESSFASDTVEERLYVTLGLDFTEHSKQWMHPVRSNAISAREFVRMPQVHRIIHYRDWKGNINSRISPKIYELSPKIHEIFFVNWILKFLR